MPAHEFAWPGDVRVPDFRMYGNKRKIPTAEGQNLEQCPMEEANAAKRLCPSGAHNGGGDMEMSMDTAMENNNHLTSLHPEDPPQMPWQGKSHLHSGAPQWQKEEQELAASGPSPFAQHQVGGVMDLCGETFSSPTRSTEESQDALMSMDSDCVPDPAQYNLNPAPSTTTTTTDTTTGTTSETQQAYCNQYCGLGDMSPTTSRVRCYCKPSWEGMLSMRPYISDIY